MVRQPARLNASAEREAIGADELVVAPWLSAQTPDCRVECASQLMPPKVGELRKPLRAEKPALRSCLFPSASSASTSGRRRSPAPRPGRRTRRTRAGRPCRAERSAARLVGMLCKRVVLDLLGEARSSWMSAWTALTSLTTRLAESVEAIGRVGEELRAEHRAEQPDSAERRDRPQRPAAVAGGDPRSAAASPGS